MNPSYSAVIFDLDGTLIDTESVALEAGIATLAGYGHQVDAAFMLTLIGIDEVAGYNRLLDHVGRDWDHPSFNARWRTECRERFATDMRLKPGATELVSTLARMRIPRAVATNSKTEAGRRKLGQAGLAHHFDHVVGFDAVARPKPAPDVYLEAARLLQVAPERCLAFEDSDVGVTAAIQAGMTVVHVPDLIPSQSNHAHFNASDLNEGALMAGLLNALTR